MVLLHLFIGIFCSFLVAWNPRRPVNSSLLERWQLVPCPWPLVRTVVNLLWRGLNGMSGVRIPWTTCEEHSAEPFNLSCISWNSSGWIILSHILRLQYYILHYISQRIQYFDLSFSHTCQLNELSICAKFEHYHPGLVFSWTRFRSKPF